MQNPHNECLDMRSYENASLPILDICSPTEDWAAQLPKELVHATTAAAPPRADSGQHTAARVRQPPPH
eukprot:744898-Pelagomonas_calceolata.AAC.7